MFEFDIDIFYSNYFRLLAKVCNIETIKLNGFHWNSIQALFCS